MEGGDEGVGTELARAHKRGIGALFQHIPRWSEGYIWAFLRLRGEQLMLLEWVGYERSDESKLPPQHKSHFRRNESRVSGSSRPPRLFLTVVAASVQ